MTEITPDDLSTRLDGDDDELVVLDIRHEDDYEDWHIPGSENIDVYDELQNNHKTAKASLSEIQDEKDIVTVCTAGVISETATDLLREMDYDAQTLVDGMNGWSRVHRSAPIDVDVDGTLVQVTRPGKGCLSYVLISDGAAAIFDPSHYPDPYERVLEEYDAELVGVFDTHAHADHISGGRALAQRHDISYHLHPADADGIDVASLSDGQTIEIGNSEVTVVHTPGHSPGGVSFAVEDAALLTGDTLFHESVGRVELGVEAGIEESDVEENAETLYESLQRLQEQPDDPLVLPAHDPGSPEPPVTARLSAVETRNADLGRDRADFVADLASDTPDHPPNFQRVKRVNIGAETVDDDELSTLELGPNRCASK
jgi:glyoxylase-like metal-dependent hydrolase (beta-lactamase superfamily II)/rhodanese-related sulfurtransferase